jgi:thioredoxin reductase
MTYDCIIVGGGAAGLSAALVLGRARKRTLVVDAGNQSNLPAHAIGGLLGHNGRSPAEFYALAREQLKAHGTVELRDDTVIAAGEGFSLELAGGATERARTVLLATGMEYRPPDIPGLAPLWGDSVFHCPFCHGWEVRDQPIAVLADDEKAAHLMPMIGSWSDDVVRLDGPVKELVAEDGKLSAVVLEDGTVLARTALLVAFTFHQRSDLHAQLGAQVNEHGFLIVDEQLQTTAAGVYAAGDVAGQPQSVAAAISSGHLAAAMLVRNGL